MITPRKSCWIWAEHKRTYEPGTPCPGKHETWIRLNELKEELNFRINVVSSMIEQDDYNKGYLNALLSIKEKINKTEDENSSSSQNNQHNCPRCKKPLYDGETTIQWEGKEVHSACTEPTKNRLNKNKRRFYRYG